MSANYDAQTIKQTKSMSAVVNDMSFIVIPQKRDMNIRSVRNINKRLGLWVQRKWEMTNGVENMCNNK